MKHKFLPLLVALAILTISCKKEVANEKCLPPFGGHHRNLKIAIISDIHYMHPSLLGPGGAAGLAFQSYLNQDPKLVEYSDPIFRKVLNELKAERPDIVLVTGDITKDGEKIGHQAVAGFFDQLRKEGIDVYVVPGNHDINNAKAKKYIGDNDYPVDKTTAEDFANIYSDFGYKKAIARDTKSLSYVVQIGPKLRLLALDASKYEEYGPSGDVAAGRLKPETLAWALDQMAKAKEKNITIYAMMHHNLIEHYTGQTQLDPGYVIDDWQNVTNQLMDAGLEIIFTGHYHANDIASYSDKGRKLYDIETGSLVTAPIPYRLIDVKDGQLDIRTKTVQSITASLPGGLTFPQYSSTFLSQHQDGYFNYYLTNLLGAPQEVANYAVPLFRNGIMAHFAGDENLPADEQAKINQLGTMSQQLAGIVTTLWTDNGEKDNNTQVDY